MKKLLYLQKIKGLLFDHLNTRQTIVKNAFWLVSAEILTRAFKFFFIIFIARTLGVTEYGKFSFALAFAAFFSIFSNLGIAEIVVREFAREPGQERWFPQLFTLKVVLSVAAMISLIFVSLFAVSDSSIRMVIWILAIYFFMQSIREILGAFLTARQRMEYESILRILEAVILTGAGFLVLFTFPSIKNISWVYVLASLLTLGSLIVFFHRRIAPIKFRIDRPLWKKFLLLSLPLGFAGFFTTIFGYIDILTLGFFGQITQIGWYSVAYVIFNIIFLPSLVINQIFFPVLSRAIGESKNQAQKIYNLQMEVMIFLAFGFLAGGLVLAPKIVDFIYDPSYFPSVFALQLLMPAAVLIFLSSPARQALIVCNQQKKLLVVTICVAVLNTVLDFIFIPRWSLYGPALATFISTAVMFFLFFWFAAKHTPFGFLNITSGLYIVGAGFASFITYFFLSLPQLAQWHVLLATLAGGLLYSLLFLIWRLAVRKYFLRVRPLEYLTLF